MQSFSSRYFQLQTLLPALALLQYACAATVVPDPCITLRTAASNNRQAVFASDCSRLSRHQRLPTQTQQVQDNARRRAKMPLDPYSCTPPCPMHLLDTQEPRLLLEASEISDESVDTLSHSYGKRSAQDDGPAGTSANGNSSAHGDEPAGTSAGPPSSNGRASSLEGGRDKGSPTDTQDRKPDEPASQSSGMPCKRCYPCPSDAEDPVNAKKLWGADMDSESMKQRIQEDVLKLVSGRISELEANVSILQSENSVLKADNAELKAKDTLHATKIVDLQADNAELKAKVTLHATKIVDLQGDMVRVKSETHALCVDKALIASSQIILRFLGRQDRQQSRTSLVRQAYEERVLRDANSRSKVEEMLRTGLNIIDVAQHSSTVDLLDDILNDRNGVAHPAMGSCGAMVMDTIIKNLEDYWVGNAVSPKQRLILAVLKRSREIGNVDRLVLLDGVA